MTAPPHGTFKVYLTWKRLQSGDKTSSLLRGVHNYAADGSLG